MIRFVLGYWFLLLGLNPLLAQQSPYRFAIWWCAWQDGRIAPVFSDSLRSDQANFGVVYRPDGGASLSLRVRMHHQEQIIDLPCHFLHKVPWVVRSVRKHCPLLAPHLSQFQAFRLLPPRWDSSQTHHRQWQNLLTEVKELGKVRDREFFRVDYRTDQLIGYFFFAVYPPKDPFHNLPPSRRQLQRSAWQQQQQQLKQQIIQLEKTQQQTTAQLHNIQLSQPQARALLQRKTYLLQVQPLAFREQLAEWRSDEEQAQTMLRWPNASSGRLAAHLAQREERRATLQGRPEAIDALRAFDEWLAAQLNLWDLEHQQDELKQQIEQQAQQIEALRSEFVRLQKLLQG